MPLFVCQRCNTIENTASAKEYWTRSMRNAVGEQHELLCTECETGTWHGHFLKVTYEADKHGPIGHSRRLEAPTIAV